jgi:DNA-directed RNA polymerase subunit RPC12/RpoP
MTDDRPDVTTPHPSIRRLYTCPSCGGQHMGRIFRAVRCPCGGPILPHMQDLVAEVTRQATLEEGFVNPNGGRHSVNDLTPADEIKPYTEIDSDRPRPEAALGSLGAEISFTGPGLICRIESHGFLVWGPDATLDDLRELADNLPATDAGRTIARYILGTERLIAALEAKLARAAQRTGYL